MKEIKEKKENIIKEFAENLTTLDNLNHLNIFIKNLSNLDNLNKLNEIDKDRFFKKINEINFLLEENLSKKEEISYSALTKKDKQIESGRCANEMGKQNEVIIANKLNKQNNTDFHLFLLSCFKEKFPNLDFPIALNKKISFSNNSEQKVKTDIFIKYQNKILNISLKIFNKSSVTHLGGHTLKTFFESIKGFNVFSPKELEDFATFYFLYSTPNLFLKNDFDYLIEKFPYMESYIDFSHFDYFGDKNKFYDMLKENYDIEKKDNASLDRGVFEKFFPEQCAYFEQLFQKIQSQLVHLSIHGHFSGNDEIDFLTLYNKNTEEILFYKIDKLLSFSDEKIDENHPIYKGKTFNLSRSNIVQLSRKGSGGFPIETFPQFKLRIKYIIDNIKPNFSMKMKLQ